jgi:hypothetical protein
VAQAQVSLSVYGDIDYAVQSVDDTITQSFQAPRLELFPTATQERLSFLAEVLFEVDDQNSFVVDVERIEVAYLFSDLFRLRAGRFHTAIGYYNDAYHHGHFFQIATDRPEMLRFEDEGGLIPAHSIGVHIDGLLPLGPIGGLRYDVEVANGRGRIPDEVTNTFDPNQEKAFNLRLRLEPGFPEGLILGGNLYFDTIRTGGIEPPRPEVTVDEVILGGHLAYLENYVHLIGEYLHITHRASNTVTVTQAGYAELGYTFKVVTPYVRAQRVVFPPDLDPFFALNLLAIRGSFSSGLAGLRFNVSDYLALKLEGAYTKLDSGQTITTGVAQCAFAF